MLWSDDVGRHVVGSAEAGCLRADAAAWRGSGGAGFGYVLFGCFLLLFVWLEGMLKESGVNASFELFEDEKASLAWMLMLERDADDEQGGILLDDALDRVRLVVVLCAL